MIYMLNLSIAQRRLIQLLRAEPSITWAVEQFENRLSAEPALQHGDMKLENVCVGGAGLVLVDFEQLGMAPPLWDLAGLLQSIWSHLLMGWLNDEADGEALMRSSIGSMAQRFDGIDRQDLSILLGLRLCQTAIEWERGQSQNMETTAEVCGLAVSLARSSDQITTLIGDDALWK
jgi:aminoglycoside phosphotransferase (APT) family kinase protein